MPELPEVEVVRRGLAGHVIGRTVHDVAFSGHRVARRHLPGPEDLADRIRSRTVTAAKRRGKYLWLELGDPQALDLHDPHGSDSVGALLVHLGMSGQLLVQEPGSVAPRHQHARFEFTDGGSQLRFVDQRTFGGMAWSELGEDGIPTSIAHIAPDPFESGFDEHAVVRRLKARDSAIKRALLDQTLISGIGNIYADEALWQAEVHGERRARALTKPALSRILAAAHGVMRAALDQGGTSFDALYVNVNGQSGYFDRSLRAYGRQGRPCSRCGAPIQREHFMNRSSFSCPRCQPRPRLAPRRSEQ